MDVEVTGDIIKAARERLKLSPENCALEMGLEGRWELDYFEGGHVDLKVDSRTAILNWFQKKMTTREPMWILGNRMFIGLSTETLKDRVGYTFRLRRVSFKNRRSIRRLEAGKALRKDQISALEKIFGVKRLQAPDFIGLPKQKGSSE